MSTRRDFLAFTAGAVAAKTVLPIAARAEDAHPDAELLAACAVFDDLERAYLATGFGHEVGSSEEATAEAEQGRLSQMQDTLVGRMCDLHAVTREGMAARAHSLALWDGELLKPGTGDAGARLTAAIVRDLLAGSAVA